MHGCHRNGTFLVVGVLVWMAASLPVQAQGSVSAKLAEGAAMVAAARLAKDAQDSSGRQLLAFAQAVDPSNARATTLQERLDSGEALDEVDLLDGGRQYLLYLEQIARGTSDKGRKLLLYKVITIIDPDRGEAARELARAQAQGRDTGFEALLAVVQPPAGAEAPPPRTAPDGKAADTLARLAGVDSLHTDLRQLAHPTAVNAFNAINGSLRDQGIGVHFHPGITTIQAHQGGGGSLTYIPVGQWRETAFRLDQQGGHGDPRGISCLQWALAMAALYDFSLSVEGPHLVLADAKTEAVPGAMVPLDAAQLGAKMKAGRVDFLNTYRGKEVFVRGLVSGTSRAPEPFVHLAGGIVRVTFAADARQEDLRRLMDLHQENSKTNRDVRRTTTFTMRQPGDVLFYGLAVCDGIMRGRIEFRDCRHFCQMRVITE